MARVVLPFVLAFVAFLSGALTSEAASVTCTVANQLFRDPASCENFYRCDADLNPVLLTCPEGFYYSVDLQSCDLKENVVCDNGTRPGDLTTTPSPTTCTAANQLFPDPASCENFYRCDDSLNPILLTCPEGFVYSVELRTCDLAENVQCEDGIRPGDLTTTPNPLRCSFENELLADPSSCEGFYKCDASLNPVHLQCADGYYYSTDLHACDLAVNVQCEGGVRPETTTRPSTTKLPPTDCEEAGQLLPDLDNCAGFYECIDGGDPVHFSCPDGQYYSIEHEYCDVAITVDCNGRPTLEPLPTDVTGTTGTTPVLPFKCGESGELHADPYDCSKFYKCDENLYPVLMDCQPGLLWNEEMIYCDYPANVDCGTRPTPSSFLRKTTPMGRL